MRLPMNKFLFLGLTMFLFGCKDASEEVIMNEVNSSWDKDTAQNFSLEIKDAQQAKNIIFVVRNNNDYPYSNIRIISWLEYGKNNVSKPDTLNYILAKPNGEWIGSGFGEVKESEFQYKLNFKFPKNGNYSIKVKQAMRKDKLPGIEDLGLKIVNAQP